MANLRSVTNLSRWTTAAAFLLFAAGCGSDGDDGVTPPNGNDNDNDEQPGAVAGSILHGGAGVGDVQIVLRDGPGSDRDATTPNDGSFSFENVEAGSWTLDVTPPDYFQMGPGQEAVRSVEVSEGQTVEVNVTLAPVEELQVVEIDATAGLSFSPEAVTVAPGTRIRWENTSQVLHTVTPSGHSEWSEGTISSEGDTFEAVLNNPGEFDYFCVPHQGDGMAGTVIVEP